VLLDRERTRQLSLHALEALCSRWTEMRRFGQAVQAGLAAVAGEPIRESAHRILMKAHLAEGNPGEAIRQYRTYERCFRTSWVCTRHRSFKTSSQGLEALTLR
jgi:DNA-binding SARP family transcriptional activator